MLHVMECVRGDARSDHQGASRGASELSPMGKYPWVTWAKGAAQIDVWVQVGPCSSSQPTAIWCPPFLFQAAFSSVPFLFSSLLQSRQSRNDPVHVAFGISLV
jgi:hypothetical protein